ACRPERAAQWTNLDIVNTVAVVVVVVVVVVVAVVVTSSGSAAYSGGTYRENAESPEDVYS
ncbi:hypothetical protein L9F63_007728, partial [Diploptera punctata]